MSHRVLSPWFPPQFSVPNLELTKLYDMNQCSSSLDHDACCTSDQYIITVIWHGSKKIKIFKLLQVVLEIKRVHLHQLLLENSTKISYTTCWTSSLLICSTLQFDPLPSSSNRPHILPIPLRLPVHAWNIYIIIYKSNNY